MHVREAERDDAEAVTSIARDSWHAAYGDFLSREAIDTTVDEWYAPKTIRRHIDAAGEFLVAEADAEGAVGGTAASSSEDAGAASNEPPDDPADERIEPGTIVGFAHARYASGVGAVVLRRIYVHPATWGARVGTALLGAVARRFIDDYDRLSAVVFAENDVGLSFYDRHGFETIGTQTTTFGDEQHDERIVAADLADIAPLGTDEDDDGT